MWLGNVDAVGIGSRMKRNSLPDIFQKFIFLSFPLFAKLYTKVRGSTGVDSRSKRHHFKACAPFDPSARRFQASTRLEFLAFVLALGPQIGCLECPSKTKEVIFAIKMEWYCYISSVCICLGTGSEMGEQEWSKSSDRQLPVDPPLSTYSVRCQTISSCRKNKR